MIKDGFHFSPHTEAGLKAAASQRCKSMHSKQLEITYSYFLSFVYGYHHTIRKMLAYKSKYTLSETA